DRIAGGIRVAPPATQAGSIPWRWSGEAGPGMKLRSAGYSTAPGDSKTLEKWDAAIVQAGEVQIPGCSQKRRRSIPMPRRREGVEPAGASNAPRSHFRERDRP